MADKPDPILAKVAHEGFLGDYKVVQSLLRQWAFSILTSDHSDEKAVLKNIDESARKLAQVFLGADPRYPGNPWNSPGQIDVYVSDQARIESDSPEERIAGALLKMIKLLYDVQLEVNKGELVHEQWEVAVDGIFEKYAHMMLGIPLPDEGEDEKKAGDVQESSAAVSTSAMSNITGQIGDRRRRPETKEV